MIKVAIMAELLEEYTATLARITQQMLQTRRGINNSFGDLRWNLLRFSSSPPPVSSTVKALGPISGSDTNNGDIGLSGLKNDTYGPWIQYGRSSSDTRYGSGSPVNGAEVSGKDVGNRKETVKPYMAKYAKISNKDGNRKKLVPYTANKFLVTANTNKSHHTAPFKENRGERHTPEYSKGSNKGKQVNVELEEDLEDSKVLNILHKDI
ncbi:hypothetical protein QYF36_025422 [Acer negundo]|nr:hypothetical protein QYF36_025422 [Acer negundo]